MRRWLTIGSFFIFALAVVWRQVFAQTLLIDEYGRTYLEGSGQVLGKGDEGGSSGGSSGSGSSGSPSSGSTSDRSDSDSSGSNTSGSSNTSGASATSPQVTPTPGRFESRVEVRSDEGRVRTEVERDEDREVRFRQEVRTSQGVRRIRIKDGKLEIRFKPSEAEDEDELAEEDEEATGGAQTVEAIRVRERADRNEVEIRAAGGRIEIRQRRSLAQTHFPLSIGPNNELIVTTPAGIKEVAILPDSAIARLLERGVLTSLEIEEEEEEEEEEGTTGTTGVEEEEEATEAAGATGAPGATPSAGPATTASGVLPTLSLTEQNGFLVYKVSGTKVVRLLGLLPLTSPVTANISAETGVVVSVEQPWYFNLFGFLFR